MGLLAVFFFYMRPMKRYFSGLLALLLAVVLSISTAAPAFAFGSSMTGNYSDDTHAVITGLREAIAFPTEGPEKAAAQAKARGLINDFVARYRRDGKVGGLASYTTMQTALNALAGHYSAYPNRPIPEKLKTRLEREFKQADAALSRGN
jgi:photosystem II Psb27 protein